MAKKADKKTKLDELWEKVEAARAKFDAAKIAENSAYRTLQQAKDKVWSAGEDFNKALDELHKYEEKERRKEEP